MSEEAEDRHGGEFDEETAKEMGEKHGGKNSWSGHRKRVLEKYTFHEDE